MFDAKSLFEMMVQGAGPGGGGSRNPGADGVPELSDLLRQFTEGGDRSQSSSRSRDSDDRQGGDILGDLMRQFGPRDGAAPEGGDRKSDGTSGGNPLEDLLRQFTEERGGRSRTKEAGRGAGNEDGQIGEYLDDLFGKGRQAAGKAGEDAQQTMRDLLEKIGGSGANAQDMLGQLTDFIGNNKVGAGVALGGLGALIFGTQTGRSIAMSAAKLGALAIVGGLAYKAYQNYSQGRAPEPGSVAPEAAPPGTGFEAEEVSDTAAVTYIRGMIAAAAADGRIDAAEQEQMIGALKDQGLDASAEEFLANELNNPASIDDLVDGVANQTEALQLYAAARIAVEPDTAAEQQFLAVLADRLGISPDLRAHVDATARGLV